MVVMGEDDLVFRALEQMFFCLTWHFINCLMTTCRVRSNEYNEVHVAVINSPFILFFILCIFNLLWPWYCKVKSWSAIRLRISGTRMRGQTEVMFDWKILLIVTPSHDSLLSAKILVQFMQVHYSQ